MEIYASDTAVANGGTIKEQKKVMNGGRKNLTRAEKEKGPAPWQALSRAVYTASPCLKYTANGPKSQENEDKQGRFNTCYTH